MIKPLYQKEKKLPIYVDVTFDFTEEVHAN